MNESQRPNPSPAVSLTVTLLKQDVDIIERYRGELSVDAFLTVVLRMIDSGAVRPLPKCEEESEEG
jgi:hypothetical protein